MEKKEQIIKNILQLRKEVREDYSRIALNLHKATLELDNFLENIQESLKSKEQVKGGDKE